MHIPDLMLFSFQILSVVLDGINVIIRSGSDAHMDEMFTEFNSLYASDRSRSYRSTITVSCGFPTKNVIDVSAPILDGVFIQHDYGSSCHPTGKDFNVNIQQWSLKLNQLNSKMRRDLKFYLVLVTSQDFRSHVTLYQDFYDIYALVSYFLKMIFFCGIVQKNTKIL